MAGVGGRVMKRALFRSKIKPNQIIAVRTFDNIDYGLDRDVKGRQHHPAPWDYKWRADCKYSFF